MLPRGIADSRTNFQVAQQKSKSNCSLFAGGGPVGSPNQKPARSGQKFCGKFENFAETP